MATVLQTLARIDVPVLVAVSGLGASFILSVFRLGRSLAKAGKRS